MSDDSKPPKSKETLRGLGGPGKPAAATIPPSRGGAPSTEAVPPPVAPSLQHAERTPRHIIPAKGQAPELAYYEPGLTALPTRKQLENRDAYLAQLEAEQARMSTSSSTTAAHSGFKHTLIMLVLGVGSILWLILIFWVIFRPLFH